MLRIPNFITVGNGRVLHIWSPSSADTSTTKKINFPETIDSLAWNHNGQVLAICCKTTNNIDDNCVSLISAQNGELLNSFGKDQLMGCKFIQFGAKSRLLCCACSDDQTNSSFVSIWDLKRMSQARRFDDIRHKIIMACLDSSDTFVYTLTEMDFSIYLLREATRIAEINCDAENYNQYTCFDFLPTRDQTLIALGDTAGIVSLYELVSVHQGGKDVRVQPVAELNLYKGEDQRNNAEILHISFSGELLAILFRDFFIVYDYLNQEVLAEIKTKFILSGSASTCFCWNGSIVALGAHCGMVVLLHWRSGKQVATYEVSSADCTTEPVIDFLSFSPQHIIIDTTKNTLPSSALESQPEIDLIKQKSLTIKDNSNSFSSSTIRPSVPFSSSAAIQNMVRKEISKHTGSAEQPANKNISGQVVDMNSHRINIATKSTPSLDSKVVIGLDDVNTGSTSFKYENAQGTQSKFAENGRLDENEIINRLNDTRVVDDEKSTRKFQEAEERVLRIIRDEIEESITNLHVDMIQQFQLQSDEINLVMSQQLHLLKQLADDNKKLQEENFRLHDRLRHRPA